MNALEFETTLAEDGKLTIPKEIAEQLTAGLTLRVLLLYDEDRVDELEFMRLGQMNIAKDDDEEDDIYDRHDELSGR